jgi:hypothetical protein
MIEFKRTFKLGDQQFTFWFRRSQFSDMWLVSRTWLPGPQSPWEYVTSAIAMSYAEAS